MPEYRQVLANLIARDLKVKYQGKALGFAWSLLAPAVMLAILYTIFSHAFRINIHNYWAYLIAGILPFQFIQDGIAEGSSAIRRSSGLIRKVYVPMEVLVIAVVTVKLIEFLLHMLLAIVLLLLLHRGQTVVHVPFLPTEQVHIAPLKTLLVIPPAIVLLYLFVLGVALPLAAWSVIYRDLDHLVTIAMRVLFYATPIFWGLWLFEGRWWHRWMALNPVMDMLALFRGPLYWGTWPFNESLGGGAGPAWTIAALFALLCFVGGYTLFDRSKRILAEVV